LPFMLSPNAAVKSFQINQISFANPGWYQFLNEKGAICIAPE
jgi:hypothetical protein